MHTKTQNNKRINIGERFIGENEPVFIIAEAGVNHFGCIKMAKALVDMAVEANVDAVKFQVYKTENLISKKEAPDWFERMKSKELPYDAFRQIKKYCDTQRIRFLATAHDEESLYFLNELDVYLYKIGSGEVANYPFIRKIARKHKPTLISIGMYTQKEIETVLKIFHEEENYDIVLLHCITAYPAMPEDINLRVIDTLKRKFKIAVGYSDHTIGNEIVYAAVAIGACVIEKHITIKKNILDAQDWIVSCDVNSLKELVKNIRIIEKSLGDGYKRPSLQELKNKDWARKSIVARGNIKRGSKITNNMICFKRPGTGISPIFANKIIGSRCLVDIKKDILIRKEYLEKINQV